MDGKRISLWPPVIAMIAFLLVWQGAVFVFGPETWLLPGPVDVAREAAVIWPRLWEHTAATIKLTVLGFAAGVITGIAVAAILSLFARLRAGMYPLLIMSQNVPVIVLGPLLVMWFGFGLFPKVLLITLICFFPVTVAMLTGLSNSDPRLMNYMQMIGAGRWEIFRRLELPGAIPYLFSGIKIAAAYSVTGAVVAEWLGGTSRGISYFIQLSSKGFMTARVFAGVCIIITLSMLLFAIVTLIERRFIRWRPREGKEDDR
ncbi:ABC transporter permease [Paenibacillus tarimensis]